MFQISMLGNEKWKYQSTDAVDAEENTLCHAFVHKW